ncbi:C-C motif chemokine 32b.3 precursor [Danio rerio]|uniref:C-C motif chemokine 32b.3 precursor n=1 Tax=Danio rerio TaxID=7955 RepID=A0AB13A8L3_DANRE|nr:C-C motif chemokine 32b.3 precursor [Danio rerio]|eukprot:XP_005162867.1 monocyte chemotactic protein 1B-like [Danio rerio]
MSSTIGFPFCLVLVLLCYNAATSVRLNCCLRTSKSSIPIKRVVDYRVQQPGICPIEAVILVTVKGKRICCDPNTEWIKKTMRKVDQKKLRKQNSDLKASPNPNNNINQRKRRRQN